MEQSFKIKNKTKLLIIALFSSFLIFSLSNFALADTSNICDLEVSLINQDPYPAIPNSYVDLVFQVSGVQNSNCDGATFELIPSYPFSLDENVSLKTLEGATYLLENKNEWMISYKIRVDKNALDGNNSIEVKYNLGIWDSNAYYTKNFDITLQDSRTTFDAVIQETSGSDVSIAIANTGKYTANSVIVRIPEQESYMASGTDGQMVGNLESGDYTIVGFSLLQKGNNFRNLTKGSMPIDSQESKKLKFDIYYTDNIGERRIVNMELPLNIAGNSSLQIGNFSGTRRNVASNSLLSQWYFWVILLIVVLLGLGFYNKYRSKINSLFSHKKSNSEKIPDWVKNAKDKEKKK